MAREFTRRAASWRALWDPTSGFLRARNADGTFPAGFDAMATDGQGYIEGNAWNYSLYVPHDVRGFSDLIGGDERVNAWGGAIALGHPLGASGARLVTTAVNRLHATGGRYALCTMCIGVGQGITLVVERV